MCTQRSTNTATRDDTATTTVLEKGILGYWERVLEFSIEEGEDEDEECEELCKKVREAISHLTSIDSELSSKVETLTLHCTSG
jgi:hypothetical protein